MITSGVMMILMIVSAAEMNTAVIGFAVVAMMTVVTVTVAADSLL